MIPQQPQNTQGPAGLPQPELGGDEMHPLLQKLLENIKAIAIGFGVLVLIFGGYAIYDYVQSQRLQSSSAMLGDILASTSGEERVTALQEFMQQTPAALETSVQFELAAALERQGQFDEALAAWNALENSVDPTMEPVVKLGKAQALAKSGKYEESIALLEGYKASAPESFKETITKYIAQAAEEAGDYGKAAAAYGELAKSETTGESTRKYLQHKIETLEGKQNG